MTNRRRLSAAGLSLAALLIASVPVFAASGGLSVVPSSGGQSVQFQGVGAPPVSIGDAAGAVTNLTLSSFDPAGILYAGWDEAGPTGGHYVTVSKDGGATWSRAQALTFDIPLRAGLLRPGAFAPEVAAEMRSDSSNRIWIVQFATTGLQAFRDRITQLGGEVLNPVPEHGHIVRMSPAAADVVRGETFVRWVGPYEPGYRVEPETIAAIRPQPFSTTPTDYYLQTFTSGPAEKGLLAGEVQAMGGTVIRNNAEGYLLEASLTPMQVMAIAHSDHLMWLERKTARQNDMNGVRVDSGANYVVNTAGYDGAGARAEVLDAGVQKNPYHIDHDGILEHGTVSVDSHGTSTYGIVFGNGNRDGDGTKQATGMAWMAQGYIADYDNLTNRYTHTAQIVTAPINAVMQSNSWGDVQTSVYTSVSMEMDDIIWINDIDIFQSQSNLGSTQSRPQAWAKNIISIGAVNHRNTATLADDCWCSGASIGPAQDGRLKPDLAYWYDLIWTTTSGGSGNLYTTSFGGTSAATPMTAGAGVLMFQMWANNLWGTNPVGPTVFDKRPHSSTMKALMINTATQYTFSGTTVDLTRTHQGWGRTNLKLAYDRAPLTKVINETDVLTELQSKTYTMAVPAGQTELKITMVYTDRAGTTSATLHRINDVTLKVQAPNGTIYWGNNGLAAGNYSTAGGSPNTIDTVENVFLQNPAAGNWTITVSADDLNQDVHGETPGVDQDYALVVYPATSLN